MKEKSSSTIDREDVERFSRIAHEWWNPDGKFKPLHRINPLRIQYILDKVASGQWPVARNAYSSLATHHSPLQGLSLLDIGCGGGLICEPMARLGAQVTGIDASDKNIAVAKLHAQQSGLDIDYRCAAVEDLVASGRWQVTSQKASPESPTTCHLPLATSFDIVLALEIVEHVADVEAFVAASCALLKPGGIIIYSTLNRTARSFALAIIGAEYVLRIIPRGTHDWKQFLRPSELCGHLRHHGIEIGDMTGMVMNPLNFQWRLSKNDLSVNYIVSGAKPV